MQKQSFWHWTLSVILDETHDTPFQMILVHLQYKNKEKKTTIEKDTIVNEQQIMSPCVGWPWEMKQARHKLTRNQSFL